MPTPPKKPSDEEPTSYSDLDRPAADQGRIGDTDSAWAAWEEANKPPPESNFMPTQPASMPMPLPQGDRRYAPTVPGALTRTTAPAPITPTHHVTCAETLAEARRNNRVCPEPLVWQKLYEMLPGKRQVTNGWEPPLPHTGSAWAATSALAKRICLRDHIEWADKHGCLDEVCAFLKSLPEESWTHM